MAMRGSNVSLVHTYGCFSDILGVIISKFFGIPLINGSIRAARPRLNNRDRVTRFCLSFATRVISNSHAGLESYGVSKNGFVIHNGVDLERFSDVVPARLSGAPVLCMVGNFTVKKDQGSIIQCLPELTKEYQGIRLLLIGRGKTLSKNKAFAVQLGCEQQTIFIEDCDSPEPFIARSDLCLLMSNNAVHGEGISNAIMEYMAMGKSVIASDSGGNYELMIADKTGYLIKSNEQTELTEAIRTLLNNPGLSLQMGQAGRKRLTEEFTIDKMIRAYVTLYETVAENR
jgi:glycosyltransferase involved in cell wall biosynthesis